MTTTFAYDAWGRMTAKSDGTYSAAYAYRYGNKLASVTSDFPSEGNATYQYDGAGKRRQRTAGGTTTRYRWDPNWSVLNVEDGSGNLTRSYVGRSGSHVDGTNPSTGTWRFYVHDHLGSTRGVYNSDKTQYAALEYTPYGEVYASSGSVSDITRRYTGHDWDDAAELYYAPYRYYAPGLARWITRDPLGMVDGPNVYEYVRCSPIDSHDPMGLRDYNSRKYICVKWDYKFKVYRDDQGELRVITWLVCDKVKKRWKFFGWDNYTDILNCYNKCNLDFSRELSKCTPAMGVYEYGKCVIEARKTQIECTADCVDKDCS